MLCLFQGEVRGVNARANHLNPNRDKIYSRFVLVSRIFYCFKRTTVEVICLILAVYFGL